MEMSGGGSMGAGRNGPQRRVGLIHRLWDCVLLGVCSEAWWRDAT